MPTKTTKKTSNSNMGKHKDVSYNDKDVAKKVVVKRRKLDLAPTRASAVAIASQANREKKKALIDKLAASENIIREDKKWSKIPVRVWTFFWFSLLLFCVSVYQAYIRPQLEIELTEAGFDKNVYTNDWGNVISLGWNDLQDIDRISLTEEMEMDENNSSLEFQLHVPTTPTEMIQEFFARLSSRRFDEAFNLLSLKLQRMWEIRDHFTSFRMNPFISGIQWELKPSNIKYISTSTYWKDRYWFDLSYTLNNTGETYYETREFVVDTSWDNLEISSIVCTTSKCSYHPIFWPENFGLVE